MADPESFKLGPGKLRLRVVDDVGSYKEYEQQFANCRVDPAENVETEDAIDLLSGGEIAEEQEVSHTATLAGNVVQDLSAAGFVNYTWDNAGAVADFWFQPRTDVARAIKGRTRIVPVTLGGDAKKRNRSDFTWVAGHPTESTATLVKGLPIFGVFNPVGDVITEDV